MSTNKMSIASVILASVLFSSSGYAAFTAEENTAGFCSFDGVISSANGGYTGVGYVDIDNTGGKGITYEVKVPTNGSYTVTLTATSDAGCIASFSATISVHDLPTANFSFLNNQCSQTPVLVGNAI